MSLDKRQSLQIGRLLRQQYRWAQYFIAYATDDASNAEGRPLIEPDKWTAIFASNNRSANTDRAFIQSLRIMVNITPSVSGVLTVSPFHYTVMIVSIRKEFALQVQQRNTPSLTTLYQNEDYVEHTLGATVGAAQWQMNPTMYKVHAIRRGMVGNFANEGFIQTPGTSTEAASAVSNIRDANRNHVINLKFNRKIQRGVGARSGNQLEWKDMTVNDINAEDQLYFVFFNNAGADQAVALHWSAQVKLKIPQ